jgi:hypothetical protein
MLKTETLSVYPTVGFPSPGGDIPFQIAHRNFKPADTAQLGLVFMFYGFQCFGVLEIGASLLGCCGGVVYGGHGKPTYTRPGQGPGWLVKAASITDLKHRYVLQ